MRRACTFLILTTAFMASAACSTIVGIGDIPNTSNLGAGDAASSSDGRPDDDGGPAADGSAPTDGGTDGNTGGTTVKGGAVNFTQYAFAGVFSDFGFASFYEAPSGYDADCAGFTTVSTPAASNAACTITVCTNPAVPSDAGTTDAGAPLILPNSGDISLKTAVSPVGIVLTAKSDGSYTGVALSVATAKWWDSGDATAEVKSNGSATSIAAFDLTGLLTPADINTPKLGDTDVNNFGPTAATPNFDRGTMLPVTYSGGLATTKLNVRLTTTSTAKKAIVDCNFDAANGLQSIPAADLGHLDKADGATVKGAYSVQAQTVKPTTSSDFTFNVVLAAYAHSGAFTNSN